jgi:hypothetical protein
MYPNSTKQECVHKLNGQTSLTVIAQHNNKYKCKCSSCLREIELKRKQIPTDARWELKEV